LLDEMIEAHLGQQRQEEKDPRHPRAMASSRSQIQLADIGDSGFFPLGRLWSGVVLGMSSPPRSGEKGELRPVWHWLRKSRTRERTV
jgi:hypothetical protein